MLGLIIPLMMFLGRAAGSRFLGDKNVWGLLFAVPITLASTQLFDHTWWTLALAFVAAWRGFEFGHGTFFAMTGYSDHNRDENSPDEPRIQTLEKFVRPIYTRLGGDINKPLYSWVCMGTKGFIMTLPLGLWALPAAYLYPAAYWYGFRIEDNKSISELISAMVIGLLVSLSLTLGF